MKFREENQKYEIPEHEFEEKFDVKPPPKDIINISNDTEGQPFKEWFFRDTEDDLEASESQFFNHTEVFLYSF